MVKPNYNEPVFHCNKHNQDYIIELLTLLVFQNGATAAMLTTILYAAVPGNNYNMNNKMALILAEDLLNYIQNAKHRAHIYQKDYGDGCLHALEEMKSIIERCHTNVHIIEESDKEQ
jgi:hypothetical protein